MKDIVVPFVKLKEYCKRESFKGWDPYDGLNSKMFQAIPFLKNSAFCRLIVIQGFKRLPFNLRPLTLVPKEYNAKGIGLFLSGYCNLYKLIVKYPNLKAELGTLEDIKQTIHELSEILISLQSIGYSGACWGYNFDWQARRLFLFTKNTPTIVATSFCATALIDAYEITGNSDYLEVALSSAKFVTKDLNRTSFMDGFLFSYRPLKGNDTVFNASMLGARLLSYCYYYTHNEEYRILAAETLKACCAAQRADGAWEYGLLPIQNWVDSFHTGYNLDALMSYQELTGDKTYNVCLEKGFNYYINHFFKEDGMPNYYDNKTYPIDIHCPGQLLVSTYRLRKYNSCSKLVDNVAEWVVKNMQDRRGYFYYQLKPTVSSKISYMRWSNAFMFHALSCYLLNK